MTSTASRPRCIGPLAAHGLLCLAATLAFTGCVGRRSAVRLANELRTSSDAAAQLAAQLGQGHRQTVAAFNVTVPALAQKIETLTTEHAAAQLRAAYQEKLAQLEKDRANALARLSALRREHFKLAFQAIDRELKPIQEHIDRSRKAAEAAMLESERYRGDLDLHAKRLRADAEYLAIFGVGKEKETEAREHAIQRLDEQVAAFEEALDKRAVSIRKDLERTYGEALKQLTNRPMKLPTPEPLPDNAEAYASLTAYITAVKKGAAGLDDHLRANSLGRGSLLHAFGSSFLEGLPIGVKDVLGGKPTSFNDVLVQSRIVFDQLRAEILSDFSTSATELLEQFKKEAGQPEDSLGKELNRSLRAVVANQLDEFTKEVTSKLESLKP